MASVCFYFQVHQPYRLRRYSYFESSHHLDYFDDAQNGEIARKVADKCYLPTNKLLLDLIHQHGSCFRVAFSLTGLFLEQMERHAPEVIDSFRDLVNTGCVELLSETYYHSLASLYDTNEFRAQVEQHRQLTQRLFGVTPQVFRNTELIYDDRIGSLVSDMGFKGVIAEGVDDILLGRSANWVYSIPGRDTRLLLKNYRLSDDIAFRFSNQNWEGYPLTPNKFAYSLHSCSSASQVVNLFMDYETFGEHQWTGTGIFDFLAQLPSVVLSDLRWSFKTPSEALDTNSPVGDLSFFKTTSWADKDRDTSAWQGNQMQLAALDRIYEIGNQVLDSGDAYSISIWRKLQTSDHFYYMSTKFAEDGDVHSYFSPYESPYDAFINYMNVLKEYRVKVGLGDRPEAKMPVITTEALPLSIQKNTSYQPLHPEKVYVPESQNGQNGTPYFSGVGSPSASSKLARH
jgi:alpha-amylase